MGLVGRGVCGDGRSSWGFGAGWDGRVARSWRGA